MHRRSIQFRPNTIAMYTLGAIFLVPLSIGVLLVNSSASQNDHAKQISRDLASMYAQGVDFSQVSNQSIAMRVADGLGVNIPAGEGVLILSKIRVVEDSDCQSAPDRCRNKGYAVVTQRYVLGNPALRPSSLGAPAHIDTSTGNVQNWEDDPSARALEFQASQLQHGEFTYVAECFLPSRETRAGVYSRTTL